MIPYVRQMGPAEFDHPKALEVQTVAVEAVERLGAMYVAVFAVTREGEECMSLDIGGDGRGPMGFAAIARAMLHKGVDELCQQLSEQETRIMLERLGVKR